MADKGIIFSAAMVRALLDGRKTQTRRLAKFVQPDGDGFHVHGNGGGLWGADEEAVRVYGSDYAPYSVGDRLYVREAWSHKGQGVWDIATARRVGCSGVIYRLDGPAPGAKYWPSIHMPREFSRLWLAVTDVRVQRVAEICSADAAAEGVERHDVARGWKNYRDDRWWCAAPESSFESLWDSLHDKPGERWRDNPWIVAVSFDVHLGNIDKRAA